MGEFLLRFGFGGALQDSKKDSSPRDVSWGELEQFEPILAAQSKWIIENSGTEPGLGWMNLPEASLSKVLETAKWLRSFESVIQVGIGGSALGNRMLHEALLSPFYNELPQEQRTGPRFYLAENPDPQTIKAISQRVDPRRTALVVVSKSGSTVETMALFLWLSKYLETGLDNGAIAEKILVITDPEEGALRAYANETGCRSLEIPPDVGGRYAVLSSVGLLSAATLGIDVASLLEGARLAKQQLTLKEGIRQNPAWTLAALHLVNVAKGRPMNVLMPYADGLKTFGEWHAQLWAESLGKKGKGSTPIRALGAIDQHSQVQLYVEGPDDKLFTLIDVLSRPRDIVLPSSDRASLAALSYLQGKDLGEMLRVEAKATASALLKAKRPLVWIELPALNGRSLGGLIFFYEYVTALTGKVWGINPFDQEGVEQGKRYAYGLMGRKGFERETEEVVSLFSRIIEDYIEI